TITGRDAVPSVPFIFLATREPKNMRPDSLLPERRVRANQSNGYAPKRSGTLGTMSLPDHHREGCCPQRPTYFPRDARTEEHAAWFSSTRAPRPRQPIEWLCPEKIR